jgi:predicted RNA-binding Zn-ribbon protein involved in translation (DUF1610 family)
MLQDLNNAKKNDSQHDRSSCEVADIFRIYGEHYLQTQRPSCEQRKVMNLLKSCRTAVLGGHIYTCTHCGFEQNSYNSCRNRHCPKCQTLVKEQWLNNRRAELLPCGYFHLVFTLPHDLNPVILCNKRIMLNILFKSASETLQAFAKDPKWRLNGRLGILAVLHTWSQVLTDHFHLHMLVPAGALSSDRTSWTASRDKFLFRNQSMAKTFRTKYVKEFKHLFQTGKLIFPGKTVSSGTDKGIAKLIDRLNCVDWVMYAKKPFGGPQQVLEYLGRYTHRVAISNNRIVSIDSGNVTFTYRDRKDDDKVKTMTLEACEFIRRFLLHVLPGKFMKIRYFGFLSHRNKAENIELVRRLIDCNAELPAEPEESAVEIMQRLTGIDITVCPKCNKGKLIKTLKLPKVSNFRCPP